MSGKRQITSIIVAVDLQRDFFEEIGGHAGALGVKGADESFAKACNKVLRGKYEDWSENLILATQDFHPKGHVSFASTHGEDLFTLFELPDGRKQMMWPDHCVQGTPGAELVPEVFDGVGVFRVFPKGTEINVDSYGGVLSDLTPEGDRIETGLGDFLHSVLTNKNEEFDCNIGLIGIMGLAFDYCVGTTALQIKEVVSNLGLDIPVTVFKDYCKSVGPDSKAIMLEKLADNKVPVI